MPNFSPAKKSVFSSSNLAVAILAAACGVGAVLCVLSGLGSI